MSIVEMIRSLYGQDKETPTVEVNQHFVHVEPGTRCQCVQVKGVCGNIITNFGVNGKGFCESCWEPDITATHELYRAFRAEGHSRQEAIELAGIPARDTNAKSIFSLLRNTNNYHREEFDSIGEITSTFNMIKSEPQS